MNILYKPVCGPYGCACNFEDIESKQDKIATGEGEDIQRSKRSPCCKSKKHSYNDLVLISFSIVCGPWGCACNQNEVDASSDDQKEVEESERSKRSPCFCGPYGCACNQNDLEKFSEALATTEENSDSRTKRNPCCKFKNLLTRSVMNLLSFAVCGGWGCACNQKGLEAAHQEGTDGIVNEQTDRLKRSPCCE